MTDAALSIDEVLRWPVSIVIQIPQSEVIIQNDWISYLGFCDCFFDIIFDLLKCEFRSMDTDDDETLISILRIPSSEIWESSLTVDTRVCPEVYNYDFALQARHGEGIRVDPIGQ
jgi:hypothetical protein